MNKTKKNDNPKLTGTNAETSHIYQPWEQDNQAWWDWYVSLADNSNSNTKDNLLEVPEPPLLKYPSKTVLKRELSRPYNLTINNIKTLKA